MTNATGAIVECYDYLPFGRMLSACDNGRSALGCHPSSPDASLDSKTSQKFTGQVRDEETRLDYFGARYFSGPQGRFMSTDPLSGWPADAQSWNRYAYARNNPYRYVDPTGQVIELVGSEEERRRALELLKKTLNLSSDDDTLFIDEQTNDGGIRYFLGINGDASDLEDLGPVGVDLAGLINHEDTVEFLVTSGDLSEFGGAVQYDPDQTLSGNVRVEINPDQMWFARRRQNNQTVFGSRYWAGQRQRNQPVWKVWPVVPEAATWHEFGHAWAVINGAGSQKNPVALLWENRMRARLYGPLGPMNALRILH